MAASIFNIAVQGLNAAQQGLATTSHNISNANTPGFSRQVLKQSAPTPQFTGSGFSGRGVQVDDIQRVFDEFQMRTVQAASSREGYLSSYVENMSQMDNLMADANAGLTPALQDFFSGLQTVSSSPASIPARQAFLGEASSLVSRFQTLDNRLSEIRKQVDQQLLDVTTQINSLAAQVAKINDDIIVATGTGRGQLPNDLLDRRDQLVTELSSYVTTTVVKQSDGAYNLFIGNGQNLVIGNQANKLSLEPTDENPERLAINFVSTYGSVAVPDSLLSGGKLGGLLDYRTNNLDDAQDALGRVAMAFASALNDQHMLGQDLNGAQGTAFFSVASPKVIPNAKNTGVITMDASLSNYAGAGTGYDALNLSDYRLSFDGTTYQITRINDGFTWQSNTFTAAQPLEFDGVRLTPTNGLMNAGDSFLIQPTRNGARDINLLLNDPAKVAAAQPFRTEAPTSNTGTAKVSGGNVARVDMSESLAGAATASSWVAVFTTDTSYDIYDNSNPLAAPVLLSAGNLYTPTVGITPTVGASFKPQDKPKAGDTLLLPPPTTLNSSMPNYSGLKSTLTVTFTSPTQYNIVDSVKGTLATGLTLTSGGNITVDGRRFAITGTPKTNDVVRAVSNTGATADNRNMLAMGELQTANRMLGGTTNFQGAYSQMVSVVGTKTNEVKVNQAANAELLKQAEANQQSVSGVNLDDEAANLMKYQQAYQAASKAIQIAQKAFEEILSIGG